MISLAGCLPLLQLTVEETLQRRVGHQFLLTLQHLLARCDFERAQTILIKVVGIDLVDTQSGIAITTPTTTQIEFGIDTSDTVVT